MTEMTKITDKKIAVVGVGGVGGYLAGMLGKTCPHLTVVARGDRKESIQKCGLRLHSEDKGEICIRPETVVEGSALSEQDYIFICVKNYSLEQVCREISEAVADHTVVIPVMNGVNPGERARKYLGNGTVVDSLIYIVAFANEDFSVTQQGAPARLCVGVQDGDAEEKAAVDEVRKLLQAADIDCMATADIQVEIWRKYILNCAYNVATAYYDNTIGQLREDGRKAEEYEMLVREAGKVALAKKVAILPEHLEEIINKFRYEHAYEATSSLQRDIRAGRKTELDVFSGYLVREAGKYGIPVPVSEKMYLGLKKIVAKQNEKS